MLRAVPVEALRAAEAELTDMLAELASRRAKSLDEAEMDTAIMHDLELQGYRLEASPNTQSSLPDDSALLAHEMKQKRRRLKGKTCTAPLPLKEPSFDDETIRDSPPQDRFNDADSCDETVQSTTGMQDGCSQRSHCF